ncbi:MAG: ribonuclease R [Proteobacteria bacterium]|nr:ribonuclease R [Pseudomonadota bacterium]
MAKPKNTAQLPTKKEILRYIEESGGRAGKRDIARAFQLKGAAREALKVMLRDLATEGSIERGRRRRFEAGGKLPSVGVVEISEIDIDGEVFARPSKWGKDSEPPRIRLVPGRKNIAAPGLGDRILARLTLVGADLYQAEPIRLLSAEADEIIGVYQIVGREERLIPTDRRLRKEFVLESSSTIGATPGELVSADIIPGQHHGLGRARIKQRLGHISDPRAFSLISIHAHGIPSEFPTDVLVEATAVATEKLTLAKRVDLRSIPLVTIDPVDARDFDDAVWAEADPDPKNQGGWHIIVAIADVAHYVRPGSALDREARNRGNSVYFPDRMVPMLPESLATEMCSLGPQTDRPCMAVHMWVSPEGVKHHHRFERAVMRSAARLTYERAQAAIDGNTDEHTAPLLEPIIRPLFEAYAALKIERAKRQPLALDLPERRIMLDEEGHVASISTQSRYDSHRLIEEFMIAANVAAAETLENAKVPCMYRVHDLPNPEKLEALRDLLGQLDLKLSRAQAIRPQHFNAILGKIASTPDEKLVNEVILRAQSRAVYSPNNLGHYGLNLGRYAHFTSPIRRYADLLVHRALITSLDLGSDGLGAERDAFAMIAEEITVTERRADAAARDAIDRYVAAFLADRQGAEFSGHITGVSRFGLFVGLEPNGVDGLVPIRRLDDYYVHDEAQHALIGRRSGHVYRLGAPIRVRLDEVNVVTGSLALSVVSHEAGGYMPSQPPQKKGKPAHRSQKRHRRR